MLYKFGDKMLTQLKFYTYLNTRINVFSECEFSMELLPLYSFSKKMWKDMLHEMNR